MPAWACTNILFAVAGFVAGLGGVVLAELLKPSGLDWPWWAAISLAALR